MSQLTGPLPSGGDSLTLERGLGFSGPVISALRIVIIVAVLVAAYRLRARAGLVLVVGILGSLVAIPYLHASDLCLLALAAMIVWEERPALAWRIPLAAGWLLASPYIGLIGLGLNLDRWPRLELAFLADRSARDCPGSRPGQSFPRAHVHSELDRGPGVLCAADRVCDRHDRHLSRPGLGRGRRDLFQTGVPADRSEDHTPIGGGCSGHRACCNVEP